MKEKNRHRMNTAGNTRHFFATYKLSGKELNSDLLIISKGKYAHTLALIRKNSNILEKSMANLSLTTSCISYFCGCNKIL